MSSRLFSRDHNTYHRRFRDTWLQREKEATRPFTFQAKAPEMAKNQYKSELLIRSHRGGRGFESLRVHQVESLSFRHETEAFPLFKKAIIYRLPVPR